MSDNYRIIFSARASADLTSIHGTVARSSPDAAAELVGELLRSIDLLSILPGRNAVVTTTPPTDPPVRSLPVRPYMVYFEVDESRRTVSLLRIRHGSRKPLKRFR